MISGAELTALIQVIIIDLVLAGDNAIVIGMAAAGLPRDQRTKAIVVGIAAAALFRIVFALFTVQLMAIIGLMLAGGVLLLWVAWKLWREIKAQRTLQLAQQGALTPQTDLRQTPRKSLPQAIWQILVADVSMSLDNVLAVAGAARDHAWVLVVGLALSVVLMGVAATFIARLLHRHPWIAYVGLVVILYVAAVMMYDGARDVWAVVDDNV